MKNNHIFKRREIKYLITEEQQNKLSKILEIYMEPDAFGNSTIRNIYYDTPNKELIRKSISKPEYKEKLRVRSYNRVNGDEQVFIEIKKKYKGIVYKRRMGLSEQTTKSYLKGELSLINRTQISREIDHLLDYYKDLQPSIFLSYDREAYFSKSDPNFRMTFDRNVIIRDYDMDLTSPVYGEKDMLNGKVILEVKTVLGIPKWLLDFFSENNIYKTSFSKYGNAYKKYLLPKTLKKKSNNNIDRSKIIRRKKRTDRFNKNKKRRKFIPYIASLLLYMIIFTNYQYQNALPYSEFYVDINPSIRFTTNRKDKVLNLNADGLEGRKIIDGIEYRGNTVDELVKKILDEMIFQGFISNSNQHLLLSVKNKNATKAKQDRLYLDSIIYSHLDSLNLKPIVLKQAINDSLNIDILAKEYDISTSKMSFVNNILRMDENLDIDELVNFSISELVQLSNKRSLDITKIINTRDMEEKTVVSLSLLDLEQGEKVVERTNLETKIVYLEKPIFKESVENKKSQINNLKYYDEDWDKDEDDFDEEDEEDEEDDD